jgi:hypothetical protein
MDWLLAQMLTAARLPFPRSYCEKSSRHGDANSFEETPVFRRRRVIDNNNFNIEARREHPFDYGLHRVDFVVHWGHY